MLLLVLELVLIYKEVVMNKFYIEFLVILSKSILAICFAFASFLLILNFYHYKEVNYKYNFDSTTNFEYSNYQKVLKNVDKKMKSVDYSNRDKIAFAKPIYEYYEGCVQQLEKGTFNSLNSVNFIDSKVIYDTNNQILSEYNNTCLFGIPYNISLLYAKEKPTNNFDSVMKKTEEKRDIIVDNAEYLINSSMGNSSYSFATDTFKSSVYNKTLNEFDLTIDNYKMM